MIYLSFPFFSYLSNWSQFLKQDFLNKAFNDSLNAYNPVPETSIWGTILCAIYFLFGLFFKKKKMTDLYSLSHHSLIRHALTKVS